MAASLKGWLNQGDVILESLISFRRAGADAIITYFALEVARLLDSKQ
jgi:porphobilinogen synthase